MQFKQQIVQCLGPSGLHRMAYWEWLPQPDAPAPAAGGAAEEDRFVFAQAQAGRGGDLGGRLRLGGGGEVGDAGAAALRRAGLDITDEVEKVTGKTLGGHLADTVWKPLKMADSTFRPTEAQLARVARAFASLRGKKQANPWKKHDNIPL